MVRMRFRPNGHRRGGVGYTLLELLVVMAIMLILIGMVASGLAEMTRSRRVKNSTANVLNVLHMARSRAISDNAITHVRVENRGPNDQWIAVYRFPKAADAIRATTHAAVLSDLGGWNELSTQGNETNYRMESQKLAQNCWFETEYRPSFLWNSYRDRPANLPMKTYVTDPLPKTLPEDLSGPYDHALLFFYPDGTASGNRLFYIRDDTYLMWVRVYRGGEIKSGDITNMADFNHVK